MTIIVKSHPLAPPLLVSDQVSSIQFRDEKGFLVRLVVILPKTDTMITSTRGDEDFEFTCTRLGVQTGPDGGAAEKHIVLP